ncbi:30S ribosome-binding factor RbfA [Patescibacteria group bacterium]|nr:30S ribosome-binding factor RbfA [Patescibacteria group bacterium]MBU4274285.1 30S ribosome-binding factor RbfA [Patescibacteria group bacterium]MBU4367836.1 30S ribosome-binding factor RbfA [Patescibacteria group bacterium]MBU4462024.1 30S ribosome-binding factor RbfA [Patescibacteria group bacterium]MCG2700258.1 30S ribosome-binding factor RbfA [Candidatus Parcubacteria bacterium]
MSKRIERVNSLIQRELGQIIFKEIELPKDILVTLTKVETSIDLANAKVYIAILPSDKAERVLAILNKMVYGLQKTLNRRLRMRPIPKIRFVEEEQNIEAARIEGILEGLKNEEK